jgi:hypothetical protein
MGDLDGRLELDELGGVLDSAQRLDSAPSDEVLAGGADQPTWGERIRATGAYAWAARHRGWLIAGAAVAAVAVAVPSYVVANRPPDVRTSIDVRLLAFSTDSGAPQVNGLGDGLFTAAYQVTYQEPGWTGLSIDGVVGPGIRDSSSHRMAAPSDELPRFLVTAAAGCDQPPGSGWFDSGFQLAVSATDDYGRVVHGTVDVPYAQWGSWGDTVGQWCWEKVPSQLRIGPVEVRAVRDTGTVEFSVPVTNPYPFEVWVSNPYADSRWLGSDPVGSTQAVPAQGSSVLDLRMPVSDCRASDDGVGIDVVSRSDASSRLRPGIGTYISPYGQRYGAQLPVLFDQATQAQLEAAREEVCRGVPVVGLTSMTARPARFQTPSTQLWDVVVEMRLGSGNGARLTAEVLDDSMQWRSQQPEAVDVVADGSVQRLTWGVECTYVPSPPRLRLVSASGAPLPQLLDLGIEPLRSALTRTCPGLPESDLESMGWGSAPDVSGSA